MSKAQRLGRLVFYSLWAVFMTALTYVLGAVSIKVLRRQIGRLGFWTLGTLISVGLYATPLKQLGLAFFSLVVLIGVFSELEELGFSFMLSAFFTLLINSLLAAGAFAIWVSRVGPNWSQRVSGFIESGLKPLMEVNPALQVNYHELMLQIPSIVVILWMASIYLAVLLEKRLMGSDASRWLGEGSSMRKQLSEIRMPDVVIWIFIGALLGAFGGFEVRSLQALSANALNIIFVLFIFQGVAVVTRFFESLRMGFFWQFIFMALIVVHLFPIVSLIGLVDYWLDFRVRLSKRSEEFNRET